MGIIRQGILGGFRQKTGSVVGAYHRGQDTIRSLPRVSNKPPTRAQLDQRFKFGLVTNFLARFSSTIDQGFGTSKGITTPMNEAVSYHLRTAITGVSPNFTIDYTKLKVSGGKLELAENIEFLADTAAKLKFTWENTTPDGKNKDATDRINLLVYNPAKGSQVILNSAAARSALTYTLSLPGSYSGDEVHAYVSFSSIINKKLVSDSLYIGLIMIV